jgi:hypothetical protein
MHIKKAAALLGLAVLSTTTACDGLLPAGGEGEGDTGDEGEGDTGSEGEGDVNPGEGEGEPPPSGWTRIALTNDSGDFDDDHSGMTGENADQVTSIYFESLNRGFIGTIASGVGALYRASANTIDEKVITDEVLGNLETAFGDFGIRSISKTSNGYVATLNDSEEILQSTDDGATFSLVLTNLPYGLGSIESLQETDTGWTAIVSEAVATTTEPVLSAATQWTELWAPEGIPPNPNPIPTGGCTGRPANRTVDETSSHTYVSADGQLVAYAPRGQSSDEDVLCISHDAGVFFQQVSLPHSGDGADGIGATAILFVTEDVGFATTSDGRFIGGRGTASIQKTTDGGMTWTRTTLPTFFTSAGVSLRSVFFAPGNSVGWALGTIDTDDAAGLVLKTEDGGDTWRVAGANADLNDQLNTFPTNFGRLQSGFALDENNIWIGGDHSSLFYSATGGD